MKKCIAVQLPLDLLEKINEQKTKTGQSQSNLIIDLLEKGLEISSNKSAFGELFFFVKVRIDTTKMIEFGQKLQNGEIDTSHTIMTFCLKDDPSVGLNFWNVNSMEEFETLMNLYKPYYKEIMEVTPVITPMNAMKQLAGKF